MPLYVFCCPTHKQFEHLVSLNRLDDFVAKCPKCNHKTKTRELTTPGEVRLVGGSGGFTGSKGGHARIVHKRVGS